VRAFDELDEREAARAAGIAINRQDDLRWGRDRPEMGPQVRLGRSVRQVANEETDSQSTLLLFFREALGHGVNRAIARGVETTNTLAADPVEKNLT
jgi:hypothetical protein